MSIFDRFKKDNEDLGKGSVAKQVVDADKKEDKAEKPKASKKKSEAKKGEKKSETKAKKAVQIVSKKATHTLLEPVVSEKSAQLSDRGTLVFRVAKDANKVEIRNAFRELYKVTPIKVNVINVPGHAMRFGRLQGRTKDYKKALVTLPEGTHVDIFEGV